MLPISTAHPYEVACLMASGLAFLMSGILFLVKLSDLMEATRKKRNGIVKFMMIDKLRSRAFMMVISALLVSSSISSINNMVEPTAQTLNWLSTGTLIGLLVLADGFMVYRKRLTQFVMVAEYEADIALIERRKVCDICRGERGET